MPNRNLRLLCVGVAASIVSGCATARPAVAPATDELWCLPEVTTAFRLGPVTYGFVGEVTLAPGDEVGSIRKQLTGELCRAYEWQDGDAAGLPVGTSVFEVDGYAPFYRLGVREGDSLTLFEATANEAAVTGREWYDFDGKVDAVVLAKADLTNRSVSKRIATITDPEQVARWVTGVLDASVDRQERLVSLGEPVYAIDYRLQDGTRTTLLYWPEHRWLQNLTPSDAFLTRVEEALGWP